MSVSTRRICALIAVLCAIEVLARPASPVAQAPTPAQVGQWSSVINLPMVGVHLVLMPSGKVFMMSAESELAGVGALVWDPAAPSTFVDVASPNANQFCAGHTLLADGRILITGGDLGQGQGIFDAEIFDSFTETWTNAAEMTLSRWYPTATLLGDGRVLVMGGTNASRQIVTQHEVYDPALDLWTRLPTAANMSYRYYPLNFLLPDGRLLVAGSYLDNEPTRALNLTTNTWATIDGTARQTGSSVMFRPGKILNAGSRAYQAATVASVATARVLDMTVPSPAWQATAPMAFPRAYHTLTMMPDGQVLVTGGTSNGSKSNLAANIQQAEMWDPNNGMGVWTQMAAAAVPQGYHSAAVLLLDGRVFVTGQGRSNGPNDPDANDQRFAEIFSPPYLFKGARPVITSAPLTIPHGAAFSIGTPDAASIASVSLVSLPAVTHGFNENQHFVLLAKSVVAGGLSVTAPADANLAPPGYYMLFIVNAAGVPSVARIVRIPAVGEDSEPPTDPGPLVANSALGAVGLDWGASTDNVAVTAYRVHRSATDGFTPGAANKVGQTVSTEYTDTSLPNAGTFYYRVIAQDAKGNVSAPSNQAFAASLPVPVPNLVDQTQAAATATLAGLGLTVGTVSSASSVTIGAGRVISHDPAAGAVVDVASAVSLVVSSGPPPVPVPNVVGLTQSAASIELVAASLTTGAISNAPSATVPAGSVISQNPVAGSIAPPGSAVALTISTGVATTIQIANVQRITSNTAGTFIDLSYTVPSFPGQNLLLVVYAGAEASTTNFSLPLSATFLGRTFARAGAIRTPASGTNDGSGIFWMPVTSNESGTIRLTFTGTCIEKGIGAATLVGADLAGPNAVETSTGGAPSLSDDLTTTTPNAMVISTAMQGNAGALSATGTGHLLDFTIAASSSQLGGGHRQTTSPGLNTLGFSAGNINRIAMTIAAFPTSAPIGAPPTVASSAAATPSPVTGTTTALGVLGADDGGEGNLTYTWATTGTPPAAVTFGANGSNAAKNTVATFTKAGTYILRATIRDVATLTVASDVTVTVNQTVTSVTVTPSSASVPVGGTQAFVATARDQFGAVLSPQPVFGWSVDAGGTVNASGLFTAGAVPGGPFTVTATSAAINSSASVTVTPVNAAPTVTTAAGASPNPATATTTSLTVLGADDAGEAGLTYTWATTGVPPAAVAFSANGTNAAKNTIATFTRAGGYSFQVTIRDGGNLTTTSNVAVTVNQTVTTITVTPASASVVTGGTQGFSATALDQFGLAVAPQPAFVWGVSGGGTINASGLFTAGGAAGGPFAVTASNAGKTGNASVTVTSPSAGVAYVQGASVTSDAGANTIARAFTAANTAANLIVVAVSWGNNSTVSCSDTLGNTYAVATTHYDSTNHQSLAICYAANIRAGANTVSATFSGSPEYRRLLIHEYRGVALVSPVDVVAKNLANGTTAANAITSTAVVTTASGDLIFGAVMDDAGVTSVTSGTGFTQRLSVNNKDLVSEDQVQAASGSIAATFTFGAAHRYLAQMVAFRKQ